MLGIKPSHILPILYVDSLARSGTYENTDDENTYMVFILNYYILWSLKKSNSSKRNDNQANSIINIFSIEENES